MPAKYCSISSCGAKTEYAIKVPRFCSSCGVEFTKAFSSTPTTPPASNSPVTVAKTQPVVAKRVVNRRPQAEEQESEAGSDYYDPQEVQERARELAASISANDFIIKNEETKVTLGSLFNNPDAHNVGQRTQETDISE